MTYRNSIYHVMKFDFKLQTLLKIYIPSFHFSLQVVSGMKK